MTIMAIGTERRRILLRLSLALNVFLLAGPLYVFLKTPLPDGLETWSDAPAKILNHFDGSGQERLAHDQHERPHTAVTLTPPPVAPVRECGLCDAGEIGEEMCDEWGQHPMQRAIGYSGTNLRLRRVLSKMRRGEPFSMGVIGGSVSTGHGLNIGGDKKDHLMHNVLFEHLNGLFPQPGGVERGMAALKQGKDGAQNVYHNGARPAQGSDYYSMCAELHIPKDVDLVIVELAINDPPEKNHLVTFENLLRALYDLPSKPAVIMINVFALMFQNIAMGGDLHLGAAMYYDTPVLSVRNALLPMALQDKSLLPQWFALRSDGPVDPDTLENLDLRHFGEKLHVFAGKLMSAYIDKQLCEMDKLEASEGKDYDKLYPLEPIAPNRLMDKYEMDTVFPSLKPFCLTTTSEEFPLIPAKQSGWENWSWKDKPYLRATKPGATLTFDIETTVGTVIIYYLRAKGFGLGNLKCWIDDDQKTAQISEGYWDEPFNIGRTTQWTTTKGKHSFNCELLDQTADPTGGKEFRLMAIMSI